MSFNQKVSCVVVTVLILLVFGLIVNETEIVELQHKPVGGPKSPLIGNGIPSEVNPVITPLPETTSFQTTYFMHGDSFAGEWELALPLIEEARNMTFIIHTRPGVPWFPPRVGYFKHISGNQIEMFEEVMQGMWKTMLAIPGPKVVFLVSCTIYQRMIQLEGDINTPDQTEWKDQIFSSIFELLDPMLREDPHLRFVNLLAHNLPDKKISECIAKEKDLTKCEPVKQTTYEGQAGYLLALSDLEDLWGDRFLRFSIQDIICPNEMCTAGDEQGRQVYGGMHLKKEWLRNHVTELDARMAPFY